MKEAKKTAVVLFNLGGPLDLNGVTPFLRSLFEDPAILPLPTWLRKWVAAWIARKRIPEAQHIYKQLGGRSPLFENTQAQAQALEKALGKGYSVFVAMRHAPPFIESVIAPIQAEHPDEVVLLPLYPQFSTTTTGSAFKEWQRQAAKHRFSCQTTLLCCYPELHGFAEATADLIHQRLPAFKQAPRLLFSAHGLPQRIVNAGDPYVSHVHRSVQEILTALSPHSLKWTLCYQSKVGPLAWTRPSLDEALEKAAYDQESVLVIPVSFVSEHSETLVELDITYRQKALALGIEDYQRVGTVSCHPYFIRGLSRFVKERKKFCGRCSEETSACWRRQK
jgi:protoporphyrin/coproporphyrin ferrochelatase